MELFSLCARRRNRPLPTGIRFRENSPTPFGPQNPAEQFLISDRFRPTFPRFTIYFGVGGLKASALALKRARNREGRFSLFPFRSVASRYARNYLLLLNLTTHIDHTHGPHTHGPHTDHTHDPNLDPNLTPARPQIGPNSRAIAPIFWPKKRNFP